MKNLLYYPIIWYHYRLFALVLVFIPLILIIWAIAEKQHPLVRLLLIYWKMSSLLASTMLLLPDKYPIVYVLNLLSYILTMLSVWFWVDLNEELANLPPWQPLPFAIKVWRWQLSFFCIISQTLRMTTLNCVSNTQISPNCQPWLEAPRELYSLSSEALAFIFGGKWNLSIVSFMGQLALFVYCTYFVHWLFTVLQKKGRTAGDY
uniref:Uncharacterized protein n=1 Tax=Paulinella chromatophora TaxID=39717 RepID=B1X4U6_PAUCH|nr:hypothetical protein PCC_0531 [Paulinella chromatophora]ACB42965.1 hypothetical protein PCC_0531 [Paulinella chromatophora]